MLKLVILAVLAVVLILATLYGVAKFIEWAYNFRKKVKQDQEEELQRGLHIGVNNVLEPSTFEEFLASPSGEKAVKKIIENLKRNRKNLIE